MPQVWQARCSAQSIIVPMIWWHIFLVNCLTKSCLPTGPSQITRTWTWCQNMAAHCNRCVHRYLACRQAKNLAKITFPQKAFLTGLAGMHCLQAPSLALEGSPMAQQDASYIKQVGRPACGEVISKFCSTADPWSAFGDHFRGTVTWPR